MTYRVNHVNSWNGWDPLQQVILGNVYNPAFFEDIADTKLRDLLQQILYETQEDLHNIKLTLESLGVDVVQVPENCTGLHELHDQYSNAMDIYESGARDIFFNKGVAKPLISPRDEFIVFGNRMLASTVINKELEKQKLINPKIVDNYLGTETTLGPLRVSDEYARERFSEYSPDWQNPECIELYKNNEQYQKFLKHTYQFWAPTVTRVGDTLVVDQEEVINLGSWLLEHYPYYKQATVAIGGHNDATYCIPKPGHIICSPWETAETFRETFPGWDVLRIENPGTWQQEFLEWEDAKWKTKGRWWDPTAKDNPELVDFVEQWLYNWVGFSEETVFEVNMLSVDENTILSLNYQKEVHDKLKSIGIEPVYCRFRHRWFWDSGLHCMTVDTVRTGDMQNYFGNINE